MRLNPRREPGTPATMNGRQLTILLMLKDRVPFTVRWLSYADAIRLPFKVFVADGGSDDAAREELSDRARFPHVDYEYVRYPPDRTYADFYVKLDDAMARISTPFVAISDNDDFCVARGLEGCVEFLQTHGEYASCGGQLARFWVNGSGTDGARHALYGSHVRWKCTRYADASPAQTARERIALWPDCYYHVQRTDQARERHRIVRNLSPRDLYFLQDTLCLLTAIDGPSKELDVLSIARQNNAPGSSAVANQQTFGNYFGRMFIPSWSNDFTNMVSVAAERLAEKDGISVPDARAWITKCYRIAVAKNVLESLVEEPTRTLPTIGSVVAPTVMARLPRGGMAWKIARQAYRRVPWISHLAVYGLEWRSRPVTNASEDFAPIQRFLAGGARCGD